MEKKIVQKTVLPVCILCLGLLLASSALAQQPNTLPGQAMSTEDMENVSGACYPKCLFHKKKCGCTSTGEGDSCDDTGDCDGGVALIWECEDGGNQYTCQGTGSGSECDSSKTYIDCGDRKECIHGEVSCVDGKCVMLSCNFCAHVPYVECGSYYNCN